MATRPGLVIGVMGAPGSGKSAAAAVLAELGAKLLELDAIGHELLKHEEVAEEVRRTFSSGVFRILDGEVSRKKLADVVFEDQRELDKLNRILHPRMVERVRSEIEGWRRAATSGSAEASPAEGPGQLPATARRAVEAGGQAGDEGEAVLVIEGALVLEMGLDELCDHVVLVCAPRETRLERVARTRGWDDAELARRERVQQGEDAARARADAVIENASTLEEMRRSIETLWEEWK
ncbi:MAG: dephospho-CoA kinase [Planctomycetota bacterium]